MEIITRPNFSAKLDPVFFYDKRARESYFAMLEVALKNLSIVDNKKR